MKTLGCGRGSRSYFAPHLSATPRIFDPGGFWRSHLIAFRSDCFVNLDRNTLVCWYVAMTNHASLIANQTSPAQALTTAGIARKIASAQASLLSRIRDDADYLRSHWGYTLKTFEALTGLHKNSVVKLSSPEWDPDTQTLELLELIPAEAKLRRETGQGTVQPPRLGRPKSAVTARKAGSSRKSPARKTKRARARKAKASKEI